MAQRKKRRIVRKRKAKTIARRKARKPSKSARKRTAKRTVARAMPSKRPAKPKLKGGATKARKRVKVVKPPITPAVEPVTEIEATEVREAGAEPEKPDESRSAPPESEEQQGLREQRVYPASEPAKLARSAFPKFESYHAALSSL